MHKRLNTYGFRTAYTLREIDQKTGEGIEVSQDSPCPNVHFTSQGNYHGFSRYSSWTVLWCHYYHEWTAMNAHGDELAAASLRGLSDKLARHFR